MPDSTFGTSKRNPWIVLSGAVVFLALAVGLILAVGGPSPATGYGSGGGSNGGAPCKVGGYTKSCKGQVDNVTTTPAQPTAGDGFSVNFTTASGGKYKITAKRKHAKKTKKLASGVAGTGYVSVPKLGKKLKAGKYGLRVSIKNDGHTDHANHPLKINKAS